VNTFIWAYQDIKNKWHQHSELLTEEQAQKKFNFKKGFRKVLKWDDIRDQVDKAIRSGQSKDDFCEEHGIPRVEWYRMKPKQFKWHKIQKQLNIKVTKPRNKIVEPKIIEPKVVESPVEVEEEFQCTKKDCENLHYHDGICPYCKITLLEKVMEIYRDGFSDSHIREVLG
jgi:hypothetical protein